jgi:hypothetical protein
MTATVENLSVAAIHTEPRDFQFGSGYAETWEKIVPNVDELSFTECADILRDAGRDFPDPDPWALDRPGRVALLDEIEETDADWLVDRLQDYGGDPGELTDKDYLEIIIEAVDAEIISVLDTYRDAVRELWDDAFAPLMNYIYPLPNYAGDETADQLKLDREAGAVCLVRLLGGDDAADEVCLALTGGGMDLSLDICEGYIMLGYLPPLHFADLPEFGDRSSRKEDRVVAAMIESAHVARRQADYTVKKLNERRRRRANPANQSSNTT